MERITKRDGRVVPFDKGKIINAIEKAMACTQDGVDRDLARRIANKVAAVETDMTVEQVQDTVEDSLMASSRKDVAREYVRYRYLRGMARDRYSLMMDAISEKLAAQNVQNQNANVDEHSFGGRIGEATNLVMKQYALDYCVSPQTKANHENNEIYIHDLDRYAVGQHNCLSVPLDDLLANGFNTRQTDVRPAQSVNTAFQLVAVLFQLQSLQQFGGVSATHLDWTMVPYVRKSFYKHFRDAVKHIMKIDFTKYEGAIEPDKTSINDYFYKSFNEDAYAYALDMTERETRQAVEGMYHNLK